jgi:hypothetical protein
MCIFNNTENFREALGLVELRLLLRLDPKGAVTQERVPRRIQSVQCSDNLYVSISCNTCAVDKVVYQINRKNFNVGGGCIAPRSLSPHTTHPLYFGKT